MAAIITEKFRLQNSAQFLESFSETNERYYMFIGKATPFTSGTSGGSDTAPPTPVDDVTSENVFSKYPFQIKTTKKYNLMYLIMKLISF